MARTVVLTGASSGIGRELALALARPDCAMLLMGRDAGRLAATAETAAAKGATVETAGVDVADADAMAACLTAFDDTAPVDLVIANAGRSAGSVPGESRRGDPPGALADLVATNLVGAGNTVLPLLPRMMTRGRGRLVFVGSLAAVRALPDMAAYSASKAGLAAWATALRGQLSGTGVGVSLVQPGFVTSPMSARHLGIKPLEMSAERAARRIVAAIEAGRAVDTFPRGLAILSWLCARLPPGLSDRAIAPFATRIRQEDTVEQD
ncbi:MAG: SDR family NAD(P)-dependent oxidoreductase [Pseudomonadota bacterium]